jgi:DMSO/TMAO reductase YedYZ molybdopterin-dependent catalytic subunit
MPSSRGAESSTVRPAADLTRRSFLKLLATGSLGLASCGLAPRAATPNSAPTPAPRPSLAPAPHVEAGRVIPVDDLYIKSYRRTPEPVPRENWQLLIGGQMRQTRTLAWSDLQSFPLVEQMHTLECIGNPVGGRLLGNFVWQGVRLRDVLALARPTPASDHLLISGVDEYFTSVPLDLAMDERSMLAFSVGGQPLPHTHGYPIRVLLPGVYGQKQPKWVVALEATTGARPGTWELQGWSDQAIIQVNSRIDYPPDGSTVPLGQTLPVSGVAFCDTSGIARVEVSVDGGQHWSDAVIHPGPSTQVWTTWQWDWTAPLAGQHVLKVRATSGIGQTQVDAGGFLSGVFPDGTTSIHSIVVRA